MSSLLCLVALLATADAPAVEGLATEAEEREAIVRIPVQGAPSFTTSEEPGLFVLEFVGLEGPLPEVEAPEAPGLIAIRTEGLRMKFLLEPWAQAEPRVEEGAIAIRIAARPDAEEDPAQAMGAAMESLASQVSRMGEGVRALRASAGDDEEREAFEPLVLTDPEPAEAEEAAAAPSPAPASAEAPPEPAPTVAKPAPEPSPAAAVSETVAALTAELVRLGFRPTPTGAMVFVAVEGETAHRVVQREGLVILELPGTRIRRANDKRPLDATFFGTPVRVVHAVEDREAAVTRIEIELLRPADITVEQLENEISIALMDAPAS